MTGLPGSATLASQFAEKHRKLPHIAGENSRKKEAWMIRLKHKPLFDMGLRTYGRCGTCWARILVRNPSSMEFARRFASRDTIRDLFVAFAGRDSEMSDLTIFHIFSELCPITNVARK